MSLNKEFLDVVVLYVEKLFDDRVEIEEVKSCRARADCKKKCDKEEEADDEL